MKKLIQLFVIAMIFVMGTQAAFANSDEETIQKGADLTQIHRLALGASLYIPRDKEAPTKANLEKVQQRFPMQTLFLTIRLQTISTV